jgi:hypothetical protein
LCEFNPTSDALEFAPELVIFLLGVVARCDCSGLTFSSSLFLLLGFEVPNDASSFVGTPGLLRILSFKHLLPAVLSFLIFISGTHLAYIVSNAQYFSDQANSRNHFGTNRLNKRFAFFLSRPPDRNERYIFLHSPFSKMPTPSSWSSVIPMSFRPFSNFLNFLGKNFPQRPMMSSDRKTKQKISCTAPRDIRRREVSLDQKFYVFSLRPKLDFAEALQRDMAPSKKPGCTVQLKANHTKALQGGHRPTKKNTDMRRTGHGQYQLRGRY